MKKPDFLSGIADWLSELPSIIKQYNNTIHSSTKLTPIQVFWKMNEETVYNDLQDERQKHKPTSRRGQLVRRADNKQEFSKRDRTNWSYKPYTLTEVIHDTIPSFRINIWAKRYNQNLLSTKLTLDENNQVVKELNPIQ